VGIPDGIRMFGILDIPVFLRAIDVLALPYPSLSSTTLPPSLLLEALAVGVPVVTSALVDLQELATGDEVRVPAAGRSGRACRGPAGILSRRGDRGRLTVLQRQRTVSIRAARAASPLWDHLASGWWSRGESSSITVGATSSAGTTTCRFGGPGGRWVDASSERR